MAEKYPYYTRLLTAVIGSAGVSGCGFSMTGDSAAPPDDMANATIYNVGDSFIGKISGQDAYPFIRENPEKRVDGQGLSTNDCAQPDTAIPYGPTSVWIKEGSNNGAYVGIRLRDLPGDIQKACENDKDGIVWVVDDAAVQSIVGLSERPEK